MNYDSYHDILNEELQRRKEINSSYSLRAFARDLELSAPRLSQVLSKKQGLSLKAAKKIVEKLSCTDEEKDWFCASVGSLHSRSHKERMSFENKVVEYKTHAKSYSGIQLEYFKVISDWYHFAILELTHLEDFKSDFTWMAKKLGINKSEVKEAVSRMLELELMREENGEYIDVFNFLATENDTPATSLKKFNIQLMKKAMEAVYEQDVLSREFSSNVMAINKEDLPLAKKRIREFRRNLDKELSIKKERNSVYCLGLQFFELTRS